MLWTRSPWWPPKYNGHPWGQQPWWLRPGAWRKQIHISQEVACCGLLFERAVFLLKVISQIGWSSWATAEAGKCLLAFSLIASAGRPPGRVTWLCLHNVLGLCDHHSYTSISCLVTEDEKLKKNHSFSESAGLVCSFASLVCLSQWVLSLKSILCHTDAASPQWFFIQPAFPLSSTKYWCRPKFSQGPFPTLIFK